jgi:hypothetical protein
LGAGDHIVVWPKPPKPRTIDRRAYAALPDSLTIRERRVRVEQPGFRIHNLVLATTLLDADAYSKDDLALLYRSRWSAELDLRTLKTRKAAGIPPNGCVATDPNPSTPTDFASKVRAALGSIP